MFLIRFNGREDEVGGAFPRGGGGSCDNRGGTARQIYSPVEQAGDREELCSAPCHPHQMLISTLIITPRKYDNDCPHDFEAFSLRVGFCRWSERTACPPARLPVTTTRIGYLWSSSSGV